MADDIRVAPSSNGADPAVATDEVGLKHYQKVKVIWGPDGTINETNDTAATALPVGGAQVGATTESAPASDTAASGLNGRLQRIAQRITSLIALFPASLGQKTMAAAFPVSIASDQSAVAVSGTVTANAGTNLNTSALVTETNDAARQGAVNELAPVSDIANSGLNGRLQRIAQNLTTLIGRLPAVAALADATANPTLSQVGTFLHAWNGTTWDRVRGSVGGVGDGLSPISTRGMLRTIGMLHLGSGQSSPMVPASVLSAGNGGDGLLSIHPFVYNGSTYDNVRGDTANGLDVDVTRLPALPAGGNAIGSVIANAGTNLNTSALLTDANHLAREGDPSDAIVAAGAAGSINAKLRRISQGLEDLKTLIALAAGSNIIGKVMQAESSATASVASSGTVSAAADCRGYTAVGILVPSTFDGSQIQFQVSQDNSTFYDLYDNSNARVAMTVGASRAYPLWSELAGWNYLKVVTVTAQATTSTDFVIALKA